MNQTTDCFLNSSRLCDETCMAFCGKKDGTMAPACSIINAVSMMGLVSAHAYQEATKAKVQHPKSAPPPKVQL